MKFRNFPEEQVTIRIMISSVMSRRVALVINDVSEERSASIIIMMMKAVCSYEMSVLTRATPYNVPEDGILRSHGRENHKQTNKLLGP
jgi:hypothetical protein